MAAKNAYNPIPSFIKTYHNSQYPSISDTNPALSQSGKVIFITGGGKGIGLSIATSFAKAGAKAIIITGRTPSSLEQAAASLAKYSIPIETFPCSVTDDAAINHAFKTVHQKHGPIDVLVSNAGYLSAHVPVSSSPLSDYWSSYETNVKGAVIVTQAFLAHSAPNATLINITSGAAHIPYIPGYSGYSSSKLALWRIMEYVQQENPELRVFNLQPGAIESDMSRKAGDIATSDDVGLPAGACLWLTTPDADFLKGRMWWSNWDVEDLKAAKEKIVEENLLTIELKGLN